MSYWYAYFADGSTALIRAQTKLHARARALCSKDRSIDFRVVFVRKE